MTLFGTLALICWIGFFASHLWGFTIQFKIVEAVNSKRRGEEQLDLFASRWRGFASSQLWSLYRMYFPEGKLVRKYRLVTIGGFGWLALALGFLIYAAR